MARIKGTTTFAVDFEVEKRGPLDAKNRVETLADLVLLATRQAHDGNEYTYPGMFVSVYDDGGNNGLYRLNAQPYTDPNNWVLVGSEAMPDIEDNAVAKFQVTHPFEANEVINLITGAGGVSGSCIVLGDSIDSEFNLGANSGEFFNNRGISVYLLGQGQQYKGVSANREANDSLSFPIPLNVGDFFRVEKDAGMGMAGGTWANAIEYTYAELEALVSTNALTIGNWYKLTDYQTVNNAGFDIAHTGQVEPLYLQATSTNSFARQVYSDTFFNDILYYNFDDNITYGGHKEGEREEGVDAGDNITISNVTTNTFDINKNLIIDGNFYIEFGDNSNWYDFGSEGLGTRMTITDLGGGMYRYTLFDTIDLTDPGYNYIYIEGSLFLGNRNGYITYREDTYNNIKFSYDFRNAHFARAKIDITTIAVWDSGTTYNRGDIVYYGNSIRMSQYTKSNQTPTLSNKYWVRMMNEVDHNYSLSENRLGGEYVTLDLGSIKMFPVFSLYDLASETATYNIDGISNFSVESDNVIFKRMYSYETMKNVTIGLNSSNSTFIGSINELSLGYSSYNVNMGYGGSINGLTVPGSFNNVSIGSINNSKIDSLSSSILSQINELKMGASGRAYFRFVYKSNIESCYYFSLGASSYDEFGSNTTHCYIYNSARNKVGNSMSYIYSESGYMSSNIIGNEWTHFIITPGAYKRVYNNFGNRIGANSDYITLTDYWESIELGSFVFWKGISTFTSFCSYSKIGSNSYDLQFGGLLSDSNLGPRTQRIKCAGMARCTLMGGNQDFDFAGQVLDTVFDAGVYDQTCSSTNHFEKNHVVAGSLNIDYGAIATYIHDSNTYCTIYKRPDGVKKLSFMGNSDTIEVYTPQD